MIVGLGVDLVNISRIKKLIANTAFLARCFGEKELLELSSKNYPPYSVAAAFAVKEAFGKALGTGVSGFRFTDVQTLHHENGKPYIYLENKALELVNSKNIVLNVSISHEKAFAVAVVIAEGKGDSL
jgi:holo-[acyl-carrier protein] synthase